MNMNSRLWMVVWALSIAVACSSSDEEGGGGPAGAAAAQFSALGDLGAQYIEANQETYDTLDQASDLIASAFAGGLPAPSIASKQAGCIPEELAGQTLLVDVQSETFTPTDPRGPSDAVQFVLLSDPQTEVGYANLTCQGVLPAGPVNLNVTVNLADGTQVMNLSASNARLTLPSSFSATLGGTLSSSTGETIQFGAFGFEGGSSISVDEFFSSSSTAFLLDDLGTTLSVSQQVSEGFESIMFNVEGTPIFEPDSNCFNTFAYNGSAMGTPGSVSGGGYFCAEPPLGDGFAYFINCFDGSIDDLVVSVATMECMEGIFEGDPTNIGGALGQVQDGTDAGTGMHNTVIGVATGVGEAALKIAEALAQQQQ